MLPHDQPSRRSFLIHTLSFATTTGLALVSGGCASIAGVQDAEFEFNIEPKALTIGHFYWWTELTIDYDTSSLTRATLLSASVDVIEPMGTGDLSFLQDVDGKAKVGDVSTPVVTCKSFPRGEQAVIMQVLYHDDLRPLFKDGHTIHIDWNGNLNPAFTQWSATGYKLRARVKISVE